jgi:hypothetical protein
LIISSPRELNVFEVFAIRLSGNNTATLGWLAAARGKSEGLMRREVQVWFLAPLEDVVLATLAESAKGTHAASLLWREKQLAIEFC